MPDSNQLPATGGKFHIAFDGGVTGNFMSCSGLSSELSVVVHQASGSQGKLVHQQLPGSLQPGKLTLTRALVPNDKQLTAWMKKSQDSPKSARVNGTVQVLDGEGSPITTFAVTNAWVSSYSLGDLKADGGNTVLTETVTLTHEGIKVQ